MENNLQADLRTSVLAKNAPRQQARKKRFGLVDILIILFIIIEIILIAAFAYHYFTAIRTG